MRNNKTIALSSLLTFFLAISLLSCHNFVEPKVASNSNARSGGIIVNSVPDPLSVRYIFASYQSRAIKTVGVGNENLVNNTKSANAVLVEMANASDVDRYQPYAAATSTSTEIPGLVTDTAGNTWTLYTPSPSTREAFRVKGYPVVRSIDWGSGPDQPISPKPQKLRFTIE